jgi:hypothetical protein
MSSSGCFDDIAFRIRGNVPHREFSDRLLLDDHMSDLLKSPCGDTTGMGEQEGGLGNNAGATDLS